MDDYGLNEPLGLDLEEVPEPEAVDEGTYNLIVSNVTFGKSQNSGKPQYTVVMEIMDVANAKSVKHYLTLPDGTEEKSTQQNYWRKVKRFAKACGLPLQGTVIAEAEGCSVTAVLNKEEYNGNFSNKVKYFVEPGV